MVCHRASVLAHVAKTIQRMVVKGLAGLVFVQVGILTYLIETPPSG